MPKYKDSDLTSAGIRWKDVPAFARDHVAWMDGRMGLPEPSLPPIDMVPVPQFLLDTSHLHDQRPRGSKAMLDVAGARARLRDYRPGAWLISPFTGWKWAKWPNGEVGWLPKDVSMPECLRVTASGDLQ